MNQKIFIIENEINLCSALTAKFSFIGFKVASFVDEQILVITNKIKAFQPNLIILDLAMPGINSLDLLSAIKADEQLAAVPVFIYAEQNNDAEKIRVMNLGAEQFFDKNKFMLDEFVERTEKILDNKEKLKLKK